VEPSISGSLAVGLSLLTMSDLEVHPFWKSLGLSWHPLRQSSSLGDPSQFPSVGYFPSVPWETQASLALQCLQRQVTATTATSTLRQSQTPACIPPTPGTEVSSQGGSNEGFCISNLLSNDSGRKILVLYWYFFYTFEIISKFKKYIYFTIYLHLKT
jgi:hypothetical protein